MSAQVWTTDELLADVRRQGHLSMDDPDGTDAELIAVMNRVMARRFVPLVRKVRSDYYVTWADQTLVADQQDYRIPVRATTNSVRNVVWVDTTGHETPMDPVALTDRHAYATARGYPTAYTIQDDYLIVLPTPNSNAGTLRVYFERRPSTLVLAASALAVTAVASGQLTFGSDPDAFASGLSDVARYQPPFSLAVRDAQFVPTTGSALTYTAASHDRTPVVGDYICHAGETPFPQLPPEMHPLLALATAAEVIRPIDPAAAGLLMADYQDGMNEAVKLLQPRQQGRQVKVRNSSSMLRRGGALRGGGTFSDWD